MKTKILFIMLSVAYIWSLSTCGKRSEGEFIIQSLPNAEYPIEAVRTGKAQLNDGVFEEAAAPGSSTKTKISLGNEQATGKLNDDDLEDAAVTLVADPGGSGTFTYLAAVVNQNGVAKPIASILLGDRIVVKSLTIQSGKIIVVLLTRKPDEPLVAKPTIAVTRKFKLEGNEIEEVR